MSNAAAWDPAAPVGLPFFNSLDEPDVPFHAARCLAGAGPQEYGEFETTNFVVCAEGTPSSTVEPQQCEDEREGAYEWQPTDWNVSIRAAATGEVLKELDPYAEKQTGCPSYAVIRDGKAHSMPDSRSIESAIGAWLVEAGAGEPGDDGSTGAAPFEATSYF
ncbi:hypothetical protein [Nocardioides alcanivorans]|uniref:hypothetical protein n=1 Tax=Nocardioides alcanivorans TaxID=2897352 RepID=UPI001F19AEEF|nr:hypothetical protein [Nocardioides alcanivorans]